ncbi:taste receptor type 2 member 8-like [Hyla sarda]|uniref:taste receptor type 2 member 8-like n=1 Tax=Hyla sarda TaxID=327740 RepID=UPI0024C2AA60|nr:taste receptor type 2 member 8-like [Hyla sarda]
MLPVFILVSMIVLGASTVMAVVTNSFIIAVNLIDKAKSKSLSPSDLIVVTLCVSNIFFQLIMIVTDYMSFLCADVYFTDEVYILSTALLMLPIYCSFWFTVCLSVNYYLQIVIATHPFLIRLKLAAAQLVPRLIMASVFISFATGLPASWNFQGNPSNQNMTINESVHISVADLNVAYPVPSTLILCSLPLVLVGIANGLIIKSLLVHTHNSDRNTKGELSAHAEGRVRAARTISCLLFLYICFYISEVLLFMETFPRSSPGFCTCLMIIYGYSPAQSIVLIFGSPKLKQVSLSLIHCVGINKEKPKKPTVLFINVNMKKTVNASAN